jgi:hypothetical protein
MRMRHWMAGMATIASLGAIALVYPRHGAPESVSHPELNDRGSYPAVTREVVSGRPLRAVNARTVSAGAQENANTGGVATAEVGVAAMDDDERMAMRLASDPIASLMPGLGGQTPEQQLESLKWMARVPGKKASAFPDLREARELSPQMREEIALQRILELTALLEADGYQVDDEMIPANPIEFRANDGMGFEETSLPEQ